VVGIDNFEERFTRIGAVFRGLFWERKIGDDAASNDLTGAEAQILSGRTAGMNPGSSTVRGRFGGVEEKQCRPSGAWRFWGRLSHRFAVGCTALRRSAAGCDDFRPARWWPGKSLSTRMTRIGRIFADSFWEKP
jgi:hypothetical protein